MSSTKARSANEHDEPQQELLPPGGIDAGAASLEVIQRGFFQIVIYSPETKPVIKLDTTMLPARTQELLRGAQDMLEDATDVVVDKGTYDYVTAQRRLARDCEKELEEARTAITGRIDAFKEAVMVEFRSDKSGKDGPVPKYERARLLYDEKLIAFEEAEAARVREEEERARQVAEAEAKRKEEEARRVSEEAERQAAELRRQAEAEADEQRAREMAEEANAIEQRADDEVNQLATEAHHLQHAPPVTTRPVARSSGFSVATTKVVDVVDPMAFFKGIVDGKIPRAFGSWDQKKLDKQAGLLDVDFDYPGCKVREVKGGRSR